ncbi:DUF1993 domain-containing protein [Phenylobacterium sp.]|jgi:hypothetical protein|uniref:DUF1993 domain-containing protein n=1 Tax=Phenylobacterium sp. TaxID=1871053 RepID=UPI002E360EA0|nr:DUF1993 domain-containing protein [Phenylobacterium sp.]HEX4709531.1 DUF1993 domain-containing protein [Phenylobacterium sp.]
MTVSLYTFVDLFARQLATLEHLLAKGAEHAKASGASEQDMLDWRLIEDMQPLRFQAMVVCNFSRLWPARAAGLPLPAEIGADLDLAGFKAAIADAKAYLAGLTAEQFAGRDDVPLTVTIGNGTEPTLPSGQWLTVFATTNLYFHLSTAYGILRSKGVQIGKIDLFASGL